MSTSTLTSTPSTAGRVLDVEKAAALAAQHTAEADRTGTLDHAVVDALRDAGFARHFVGARRGGTEGTFAELTRAVRSLGEKCAATAWCASLAAYSARFAAHLPQAGHDVLWGESPDAFIATALMPGGRAKAVDGGWRLEGRWAYVSGIDFADWVLVCAAASGTGDSPELRFFLVPRSVCTVDRTWDSIGMRASGSHTVAVAGALVPEHLSFARADLVAGRSASSDVPVHNVPFQAVGGVTFVAPIVGAATGALHAAADGVAGRRRTHAVESALVKASARIEAAGLLVGQNAEVLDERRFTPELMARNERNGAAAAELLQEALGLLIRGAGTGGLGEGKALQRFWRDVTSASSHVALQYDTAARTTYSTVLLGPAD